jgi:hypothetical protein
LTNSCTINIVRYANAAGRGGGVDFRHYLNGLIDAYLYESGPHSCASAVVATEQMRTKAVSIRKVSPRQKPHW